MYGWDKYTAEEVLTGTDKNGNRLISAFAKDYKTVFNQDICPTCKDFKDKFQKYLKKVQDMSNTATKNSGFVLKKMYENIPLEFGSNIYVNNQNITDAYAKKLIKNHPRGEDLFDVVPESVNSNSDDNLKPVEKLVKDNDKAALKKLAESLGITELKGNKTELATLIIEKQSSINSIGVDEKE